MQLIFVAVTPQASAKSISLYYLTLLSVYQKSRKQFRKCKQLVVGAVPHRIATPLPPKRKFNSIKSSTSSEPWVH